MIKIVAKRYLKAGVVEEYMTLAKELVDLSRQEEGCVDYGLYYQEQQNLAVMMETWIDQECLDRHLERIITLGWPGKLNAYADPERSGGAETYQQLY